MKRALKWVGVVVALLVLLAGAAWYSAFGNNKAVVEGRIVDGVETVKDGFVNVFIVDAAPGRSRWSTLGTTSPARPKAEIKALAFGHTGSLVGYEPLARVLAN